ncbi:hypothetical protein OND84_004153 [Morganella morganii]|nr:hypothetical protein [Providencia sp. PROV132]EMB6211598.1 hypothetical protein [Morganella morganii]EMB6212931.1 hypothetical protein [Morganella morganii]
MKKTMLVLLVGLANSTMAQASFTILEDADTQAYESPNYDGGLYGSNVQDNLPKPPATEEKPEPEPIHSVDVGQFSVAGIRLGMDLNDALEAANKHAEQRNINGVRTQSRDGKVTGMAWANSNEEVIVQLIDDTEAAPDKSLVKAIRYTFNNPDSLVAGAIEKYGEPSTKSNGKFIWCAAKSDVKSECDKRAAWMQIDTYTVSSIGILDAVDPTLIKRLKQLPVEKDGDKAAEEKEAQASLSPGL